MIPGTLKSLRIRTMFTRMLIKIRQFARTHARARQPAWDALREHVHIGQHLVEAHAHGRAGALKCVADHYDAHHARFIYFVQINFARFDIAGHTILADQAAQLGKMASEHSIWVLYELAHPRIAGGTKSKEIRAHRLAKLEKRKVVDTRRRVEGVIRKRVKVKRLRFGARDVEPEAERLISLHHTAVQPQVCEEPIADAASQHHQTASEFLASAKCDALYFVAVGDVFDPALPILDPGRHLFAQSIHHLCMLHAVLLDGARLKNAAVETCPHLSDSRGIRAQVLKQSELAQQSHLLAFDFFSA